jgi:hypothetical protein
MPIWNWPIPYWLRAHRRQKDDIAHVLPLVLSFFIGWHVRYRAQQKSFTKDENPKPTPDIAIANRLITDGITQML